MIDDFVAVLGIEPCYVDPGVKVFGLENTLLPVGDQFLEVVAPLEDGTAGGRYLERRGGNGGYMTILQCDEHEPRKQRVEALGVRVAWVSDTPGEYRCMQLHPRDTGGTFLEIDEQLGDGAHAVDGPWHPAGPHWQRARRTELVRGIAAAEIQSDDPRALALRWAGILELPLEQDDPARLVIRLDNADLRFVAAEDGRGEGLGGIDVVAADAAQLLAAARRRGCTVVAADGSEQALIGGLRLNLVDGG